MQFQKWNQQFLGLIPALMLIPSSASSASYSNKTLCDKYCKLSCHEKIHPYETYDRTLCIMSSIDCKCKILIDKSTFFIVIVVLIFLLFLFILKCSESMRHVYARSTTRRNAYTRNPGFTNENLGHYTNNFVRSTSCTDPVCRRDLPTPHNRTAIVRPINNRNIASVSLYSNVQSSVNVDHNNSENLSSCLQSSPPSYEEATKIFNENDIITTIYDQNNP